MNKFFDNFYNFAGFGPAVKSKQPTAEELEFFEDKLPNRLLEYWQEYGFCGWGEGLIWVVNPADYADILMTWLSDTPFENADNYYVIARSAFGELIVWGEKTGQSIDINVNFGMIFPTDNTEKLKKRGEERSIELFFASMSKDSLDKKDLDENPLFERAMAKLGPLEADEMYGFVPALAIGGAPKLENLQKVKVLEHLTFLADLGEKTVMADIVAMSNALHK
ncbi:GAD-like domain-containing protein [Shewanella woodyi]|uniref:GAD-like domain protein n=1 Tax=Shewanella woodyi (strain ATCC 51908 / MS32) TaxID=392500 RepID=B1KF77_SHEWM|nr:GAD-like domain-containing protein [Shewanella woodyi]ACA86618.1 GAD-like domain protein [Shewanella woodyi ATCC 51908]